jgi:shikimate kinase
MNSDKKIILIGPMGVGKSTLGKILAQKLNWRYIDNDVDMATQSGMTIAQLSALPVPELHKIEAEFIKRVIQQDAPLISGAAASVIENEDIREMLKNVYAVYLSISVEKAIERASTGTVGRQALTGEGTQILRERFARRDPLYRSVASLIIEQSGSPENDAEIILKAITFK